MESSPDLPPARLVRVKIRTGVLPNIIPSQVTRGKGDGRPCSGCEIPIDPAHIHYEIAGGGWVLQFHADCVRVWQSETGNEPLGSALVASRDHEAVEVRTLSLDRIRSVTPGIDARDLADWFDGDVAGLRQSARHTVLPLLVTKGFDVLLPINLWRHGDGSEVTLYQTSGARRDSTEPSGRPRAIPENTPSRHRLADEIPEKLTRLLPRTQPVKTWAGYGSGEPCAACDRAIAPAQIEYELDMSDGALLKMHAACHGLWMAERIRRGWTDPPAPDAPLRAS